MYRLPWKISCEGYTQASIPLSRDARQPSFTVHRLQRLAKTQLWTVGFHRNIIPPDTNNVNHWQYFAKKEIISWYRRFITVPRCMRSISKATPRRKNFPPGRCIWINTVIYFPWRLRSQLRYISKQIDIADQGIS